MRACKNQKPTKRGVTQSGGRNEKPRKHWRVAGYPFALSASFANVIGGGAATRPQPYQKHP